MWLWSGSPEMPKFEVFPWLWGSPREIPKFEMNTPFWPVLTTPLTWSGLRCYLPQKFNTLPVKFLVHVQHESYLVGCEDTTEQCEPKLHRLQFSTLWLVPCISEI